jgi:hypothetical protein
MVALNKQIELLYDSIGRTVETDITKIAPAVHASPRGVAIMQDFRGGRTDAQLENDIQLIIHNICSLEAELRGWARKGCRGVSHVEQAFQSSADLKLLFDLWNRKKHCGVDRKGGFTGRHPALTNFNAQLVLGTPGTGAGTSFYTCAPNGRQTIGTSGTGAGVVAVNADIVDEDGNYIDEFQRVAARAVDVWLRLVTKLTR